MKLTLGPISIALLVVAGCSSSSGAVHVASVGTGGSTTAAASPSSAAVTTSAKPTTTVPAPTSSAAAPTSAAPTTSARPAGGKAGTRKAPVPLGAAMAVGAGWEMTVNSYEADATGAVLKESTGNEPPPSGVVYVMANITLTYTAAGEDEHQNPYAVTIKALGSSGTSHTTSDYPAIAPDELPLSKDVFHGGSVTGNLVFGVPEDEAGDLLIYANAVFDENADVFFATNDAQGASTPDIPSTTTPTTTAEGPAVAGTRGAPIPLGTAVGVGDGWVMSVTAFDADATDTVLAASEYNEAPAAGHVYATADVTLTYTAGGPDDKQQPYDVTIKAVGPKNVSSYRGEVSVILGTAELPTSNDVFRGGSVSGKLVFDVAKDEAAQLVLYAKAGFDHDEVFFATNDEQSASTPAVPDTTAPATTAGGQGDAGSRRAPVPLGTEAKVGDGWQLRVDRFVPDATSAVLADSEFNPKPAAGHVYVTVDVTLTYTTEGKDSKQYPYQVTVKVVGPSNVAHERGEAAVTLTTALDGGVDVFQGSSVTGTLVFEVPQDDVAQLVLYAVGGYDHPDVFFALS